MSKKRGLGRGLSALLEDSGSDVAVHAHPHTSAEIAPPRSAGIMGELPVDNIEPNPFQPRTHFSNEALAELATSIRALGVIQPVTVRKLGHDRYQLISGERRFRASQAAGLTHIPAFIRIANDEAMLEMALVENIQREDLDAIEVAISYKRLIDEVGLTQEQLSEKVGKDRATVANYLRLLKLPPEIQLGLRQKQLTMGHARALITISDPAKQLELYQRIVESQLSVRAVEELARTRTPSSTTAKLAAVTSTVHKHYAKELAQRFGTRVNVKSAADGKGRIEIVFRDAEDLQRIKAMLG